MSESEAVFLQDAEEEAARAIHGAVCETSFEECTAAWYGSCRNAAQRAAQVLVPFGHRAGYLAGLKAAEDAVSELAAGFIPWSGEANLVDRDALAEKITALRGQNTEGGA